MTGLVPAPPASAALPTLTVYATPPTVRTSLHLQPGFALIVRADRRIETVAIGDPRMVSAAPVRRGADVFDVVLQPLADTGTTNMVLWLGDVTTVWNLEIGPSQRTADVVFVVTKQRAAPSPPTTGARRPADTPPRPPVAPSHTPSPSAGEASPAATGAPSTALPAAGTAPAILELRETTGPVTALFRAYRTRNGIVIRYEITNGAHNDLVIKPSSLLVRADGRTVAYGMGRDSVDRGRPELIPRGATESGVIDVAVPAARKIELALSLLPVGSEASTADAPAARAGTDSSTAVPVVLQATFSGLDRLPLTVAP